MAKEIFEWVKTIVVSVIIALLITTFVARPTLVKQESMYPTLLPNDYLILDKLSYRFHKPKRGDIIVFRTGLKTEEGEDKNLIKRVIAVEGDEIVVKEGKTYLNGQELEEDYVKEDYIRGDINMVIPKDKVFVMGDNRDVSYDSRDIGPIEANHIRGKILVRLFPFNKIGGVD